MTSLMNWVTTNQCGDGRSLSPRTTVSAVSVIALVVVLAVICLLATSAHAMAPSPLQVHTLGFTELRTDLPGGRHPNISTGRACIANADGSGRRELAPDLDARPDSWTQFAGWSPDGTNAVVLVCRNSADNAAWEESHRTFRHTQGWLIDIHLFDLVGGKRTDLTSVERVSPYNSGLFFWPGDPGKLGFTALIDGVSHPFQMNRDGRNKRDLSSGASAFTYGFEASPDGRRISYHKDYRVHLANSDGSHSIRIETGNRFNFGPKWSPDGEWLVFLSGERQNCHPYLVRADGSGLRKLADRGGYEGKVDLLDVPDFHGGSSDLPAWEKESRSIVFAAKVGNAIELMRVDLDGAVTRLTHSSPGVIHYHPVVSPDGKWIAFGSTRSEGRKELFVMSRGNGTVSQVTRVAKGWAAFHAHWKPSPRQ